MNSYQLNIKLGENLDNNIKDYYLNYTTKHDGDAGIDLVIPIPMIIRYFQVETINFNISTEMINLNTNEAVSYYLYPRSSISSTPLILANSVGIIDAGYRGNIMAKVRNISFDNYTIHKDTRLFQICAPDLGKININVINELSTTTRGSNGFGSTGKSI